MLVIGSVQTAYPVRSAAGAASAAQAAAPAGIAAVSGDRPAHFSMISTISPGSLAAAYHAMRAPDASSSASAGTPAILSGQGIPSALGAYGEVLDID